MRIIVFDVVSVYVPYGFRIVSCAPCSCCFYVLFRVYVICCLPSPSRADGMARVCLWLRLRLLVFVIVFACA